MSKLSKLTVVLFACATQLIGCAEVEEDATSAQVTLIDQRTSALTSAQIESINGSYTNCANRTGSWSLAVTGSPTLDNAALSVIKGDTGCTLAVTGIRTAVDGLLAPSAPISLGAAYGTARSVGSPIKFFANAMLSAVSFSGNFTLTLLFSDDPRTATGSNTASYAVVSATATAQGVTAPNYTLDMSGVSVTTDINKVTAAVSGNVVLTAGSTTGDGYVIVSGAVADTYAAIHAAYTSPTAMATSIVASNFLATSVDISSGAVRSLIIAKTTSGVTSYQKFAITFNGPS